MSDSNNDPSSVEEKKQQRQERCPQKSLTPQHMIQ